MTKKRKPLISKQRNYYFMRRFRRLFLIILIPSVLLMIPSLFFNSRNVVNEIRLNCYSSMDSVDENLGLVMESVGHQVSYLTNMPRMNIALKHVLSSEEPLVSYADNLYLRGIYAACVGMANSYDIVQNDIVYYEGADRIISSDGYIQTLQQAEDHTWLSVYQNMPDSVSSVMVKRDSPGSPGNTPVLMVIQKLLVQKGCFVMRMNVSKLRKTMNTFRTIEEQQLVLLDSEGSVLAGNLEKSALLSEITRSLSEAGGAAALLKQSESVFLSRLQVGNTTYMLGLKRHADPDIYILSAVPRSYYLQRIYHFLENYLLIIGIDFLVILLLSYRETQKSFRNINAILQMFSEAEKGRRIETVPSRKDDEYGVIMNNIIQMFLNSSFLTTQLREQRYREENAELMALQLQINPHFLFNTLQTLDLEVRKLEGGAVSHRIIENLSEILKYALEKPDKLVSLSQELDFLKKYMRIQNYRFGDRCIVYYDVEEDILDIQVFRLMLQPILENSLLHGIRYLGENQLGHIEVEIKKAGQRVQFSVRDDGIGMDPEQLRQVQERIQDEGNKSIGLVNLNRRLRLHYGGDSVLKIRSEKNAGTTVEFSIPCPETIHPEAIQT